MLNEKTLAVAMASVPNRSIGSIETREWFAFSHLGWVDRGEYPGLAYRLGSERRKEICLAMVKERPEYIVCKDFEGIIQHGVLPEHIQTWEEAMRWAEAILKLES